MLDFFINKLRHSVVTLRFSILSIFVALFLSTMLLVLIITSIRFTDIITYTSRELMNYASRAVLHELTSVINPAEKEGRFSAALLESGVLEDSEKQLVPFTFLMTQKFPLMLGVFWADEHGDYVYSVKEADNSITTEIYRRNILPNYHATIFRDITGKTIKQTYTYRLDFDPRMASWYLAAKKQNQPVWSDLYTFPLRPINGITTATPVTISNQFQGVFGINISLDYLSQFITHQKISPNGFSFIIRTDERLIAYPKKPPFTHFKPSETALINVHDIGLPVVDASLDYYKKHHKTEFSFVQNGETYFATYIPVKDLENYGWLIGVIVPSKDFTNALNKMFLFSLLLSLIALLLSILIVSMLVTRIVRPIRLLVKETEHIKNFELDKDVKVRSRIKEVIYLRDAIRSMKNGLKSFQKFVPKTLVRQLIDAGVDIRAGGTKRQLAILFTDIENFTTIVENMSPNELMLELGEYLEALSQILIHEKGTIDKYIGDSIMAFWGAPVAQENACFYAANAALLCQQKLKILNAKWTNEGRPPLITRIGIHTGDAIVGNIGSSERLNYTALGDTINVASRLEKINKIYQTHILVSQEVFEQIKNHFVLRLIDCVAVKGKKHSSFLYELLGKSIDEIAFDVVAYRKYFENAFALYQDRKWDNARDTFQLCCQVYPEDTIAPIFIKRCSQYKMEPPPASWQGITKFNA